VKALLRPLPLRPGDAVAVVAPSGPVEGAKLERGLARLREAGYEPVRSRGILSRDRYLAGSDEKRAERLRWAFDHPEARAVWAARGGYGATRLLPLLDWRALASRRKLVVGYSDVTAILSFLSTRLHVPTVHGPMPAADLSRPGGEKSLEPFARLVAGETECGERWGPPCVPLRGGTAEGILAGGCLSVLTSLLGTPYEPDFRGAILFLEDVAEPAYRIDRMLAQWLQSGRLSDVRGILVGRLVPARGETEVEAAHPVAEAAARLSVPCWYGFPAGHGGANVPIPFGVRGRVDGKGRLSLLESPVGDEG
jgi:muramoyltetrapeptide carboxypeptidase